MANQNPEQIARDEIDTLLEKAGWVVLDKKKINFSTSLDETDLQLSESETLRQSILKKAFSGQLVPQDPNHEPASELLARIRSTKSMASGK